MMRKALLIVCGMILGCTAAQAQNPFQGCPTILSHDAFLQRGGKLAVMRLPDVPSRVCTQVAVLDEKLTSKARFETSCDGSVQFHMVVKPDGSVRSAGVDHVQAAGMAAILHERAVAIRFAPPRLRKEPFCVKLDVRWDSTVPGKLRLPDDLK
jgi:hypothetical protein